MAHVIAHHRIKTKKQFKQMVSEFQAHGVKATVRKYAVKMLDENKIQGYLAFDGEVSIVCFEIAPEYRGMGIALAFIDKVCEDAKEKGYVAVEGYAKISEERNDFDYQGPIRLYQKAGFSEIARQDGQIIMRKILV